MKNCCETNLIILFVFLGLRDCHQLLQEEINSVELRIALQLDHFVDLVAVSRPARMVCLCLNSSTEHGKDRPSDADEESPESLQ
jgi:hypothetical protein